MYIEGREVYYIDVKISIEIILKKKADRKFIPDMIS